MSAPDFRDVLDYLCGEIRSTQEREEVEAELFDHLMTKYEIDRATGMTPEEAEESAVQSLGDLELVHKRLLKLHRRDPKSAVNTAFVFWGFPICLLLYLFSLDYIAYDSVYDRVINYAFYFIHLSFCFVIPIIMLRTVSRRFRPAIFSAGMIVASGAVFGGLMPYLFETSGKLKFAIFNVSILFFCVGILLLLDSLRKTIRGFVSEKVNRLFVSTMIVLSLNCLLTSIHHLISLKICGLTIILSSSIKYGSFGNSASYWVLSVICLFFVILSEVLVIRCLVLACGTCKREPKKTLQFNDLSMKSALLLVVLIALFVYVPHIIYINRPSEMQTVEDTDVLSAQEEARIRGVLSTYGIPEATLALLPESELALYATAREYVPDEADFRDYIKRCPDGQYDAQEEYNDLAFHEYAVVLSEEKDAFIVRILYHLDYRENEPQSYRRRLEIQTRGNGSAIPLTASCKVRPHESDPAFLRLIYQRGETACDCKPFYFKDDLHDRWLIIEYAERDCTDLLFARTYRVTVSSSEQIASYSCDYICKRFVRPVQLLPKLLSESEFGYSTASKPYGDGRYQKGAATQIAETSYHCWKSPDFRNGENFFTDDN